MNPQQKSPQPPQPPQPPAPAGNIKQQVVDRLQQASNVLVTVSNNPSVDQLSACIGITVLLNKLGKHATAVFSGEVPSTIEFLQPDKTLEKNTDSLRDFIIALDKSKADKLRYKIEDKFVKIFITPYRTTINEEDLEFSQGDFNVDVVLALGVHKREELDQAITAHGRILHDATVISVNTSSGAELGSINWRNDKASSLCEMMVDIGESLKPGLLDGQMSTAFLTGIVAETKRFSNAKTSAQTMSVSAKLINAGANQQLVATKLEEPKPIPPPQAKPVATKPSAGQTELPKADNGELQIPHDEATEALDILESPEEKLEEIEIDDQGTLRRQSELERQKARSNPVVNSPPTRGTFTANTQPEPLEPSADPLSQTSSIPNGSFDSAGVVEPDNEERDAEVLRRARQKVEGLAKEAEIRKKGIGTLPLEEEPVNLSSSAPDPEDLPAGERKLQTHDPSAPPPVPPPLLPPVA